MKKLLLLMLCVGMGYTAQAQRVKYLGEVETGYMIGAGGLNRDRVPLHLINGIQVGKAFSAGVGIGVDYHTASNFSYDKPELMLPIFLNAKVYLPLTFREKTLFYGSVDLGYALGVTEGVTGNKGVYFSPGVGVKFVLPNSGFGILLGVGYNVQHISEKGEVGFNMGAVLFKAGFQF